jgi:hypothetical protein
MRRTKALGGVAASIATLAAWARRRHEQYGHIHLHRDRRRHGHAYPEGATAERIQADSELFRGDSDVLRLGGQPVVTEEDGQL